MKFLCGNCKAKYQIADEKASGRTLRMKCRRCGHDILIDGHVMQPGSSLTGQAPIDIEAPPPRPASVRPPAPRNLPLPSAHPLAPPPRPVARVPGSPLAAEFRRQLAAPPQVPMRSAPYDLWHVAIQSVPVGPMSREELSRKIESGAVSANSLCWREGMDDWRALGELAELAGLLRQNWRGPRAVAPPAVPSPAGARSTFFPSDSAIPEDEGSEATRVAGLSGTERSLLDSSVQFPAPHHPPAAPSHHSAVAPLPESTPLMAEPSYAAIELPRRASSWNWNQIALGLLAGIVFMGAPMLFRQWIAAPGPTFAPPPVAAPAPSAPAEAPETADVVTEIEETAVQGQQQGTANRGNAARNTRQGAPAMARTDEKKLSEQERALLERMGGGGTQLDSLRRDDSERAGPSAGPALTASQLTSVVQSNKTTLTRCYETALRMVGGKQDDTLKIKVAVSVGSSGVVRSVTTHGDGLGNMVECIKGSVKRWRFPAASGDSDFEFPLVFQPGS